MTSNVYGAACPAPNSPVMSPCEVYVGLRDAYLALISGNSRIRVKIGDRETWFNRVDIAAIRTELSRYEQACLASDPATAAALGCGTLPSRFGSVTVDPVGRTAGYRRRSFGIL